MGQFATRSVCDLGELLNSAKALELAGQYNEAYRAMKQCDGLLNAHDADMDLSRDVKQGLWRLSPVWWANVQHDSLILRRCRAQDADFFRQSFADVQFTRQFNRQRPWSGNLEQALQKSGQLPPIHTGLLMWVIQSATRGPIGMASLSGIDTKNLRAELSIGIPGDVPSTLGIKTVLMMLHFGLVMMPFNKLYAYIYEDNPKALHNALRLGFQHEGRLQDHFHIAGHGFVSVNHVGLTRAQMHGNVELKALAGRKIGQIW